MKLAILTLAALAIASPVEQRSENSVEQREERLVSREPAEHKKMAKRGEWKRCDEPLQPWFLNNEGCSKGCGWKGYKYYTLENWPWCCCWEKR
ncbi:hypothetical protein CspeluHIS016_0202140 [Cutaneotrichosporon spelunceum]|uniref:Invertebrate defensins family profile domain-containing protein n=1 Tax=Cutaneotrichosporon spelunceum TaxID=1672016 RepID=A0AAD3TR21_9TREE|nr:hypothetical protein CspeluHIS016_0202140 [Cutaneotrichosporon spelunceum]